MSFNKIINQFRKTIDTNLKKIYFQGPSNMVETANFVMSAKGKRIRPVLTMMSCDVLGGKVEQSIDVGIAIELLHNFTLVHDDIMDGDSMRHGQPTVHKKWDIGTGVLTGDSLLWLSLHVLRNVDYDREQILLKFIDAIKIVCEGQAYDKMFESKDYITTNEYESMISMKTGYMIGLCSELGAICSKSDADIQQKMKEYGLEIGKAYQIQDDYMEMYSTEKIMKKSLKSDIELNKKTYMVCLASDIDPIGLSDILNSRQSSKHKMKLLRKYFEELNVKDRVIEEIDKSFKKAETILREIDFKKDYLFKLNEYLKNRRY